jgi:hypothetical protein
MKKVLAILAVIALVGVFAATSMASEWNFYGHSRVATFVRSYDEDASGTGDSESNTQWAQQGNSRIGAKVKASDTISGIFEYGTGVNLRLLYGTWNFGGGSLVVGQDYTPISQLLYSQVVDSDNGLVAQGAMYGGRVDQIKLKMAGFQLALIENAKYAQFTNETMLPKVEASYTMMIDKIQLSVRAGYQGWKDIAADESYSATMFAADVYAPLGPATLILSGYMGTNGGDAGWLGGGNVVADDDSKDMGFAGAVGFSASEALNFEIGAGYISTEQDTSGAEADEAMTLYAQCKYNVAPGFFVVPEVGMMDFMDDAAGDKEGSMTYFGAKWEIRF